MEKISEMSNFDRNELFEECFQLGLNRLLKSVSISVKKIDDRVILTETPIANPNPVRSFFYWSAFEGDSTVLKSELVHSFKHIYISNLNHRHIDCPSDDMYDHDLKIVEKSALIAYNQMIKKGLIKDDTKNNGYNIIIITTKTSKFEVLF